MTQRRFETGRPRAAVGSFPYPGPTLAQVWADEEAERLDLDSWGRERQYRSPTPLHAVGGR